MMEEDNVREAYHEMMREKNALKSRAKRVNQVKGGSESEDDEDMSEDLDEEELRKRAIDDIEGELENGSEEDSEG